VHAVYEGYKTLTARIHNLVIFSVGTIVCAALCSCSRSVVQANATRPEVPVRAAVAISRDVPLELFAVGNVEAINSVEVKSRVAGQIDRVAFEEGQNVRKGQLLFTIDPETLKRQLSQQSAEVERDSAMEIQARAVVQRDAASLKQSVSEAKVGQELAKEGVLSRQHAEQLLTVSETAAAALRSDEAAANAAAGTAKASQAHLNQTRLQLGFTSIVAPIDGRAGAVMIKAGNMLRENDTTLVSILQISPIYVTFGIPEQMLAEVQHLLMAGPLTVEVTGANGTTAEGRLVFIDNIVEAGTGTVKLKAVFANTNQALWPGQFANVRLRLRVERNKILVPASSVEDGQDGKYLWLINSGIANTTPVTVLRTYKPPDGPEQAIIASGLAPGQMVVTEGQLRLTPGSKVRILVPVSQTSRTN
jgi:membrane fusion protein, multidrug efflux system